MKSNYNQQHFIYCLLLLISKQSTENLSLSYIFECQQFNIHTYYRKMMQGNTLRNHAQKSLKEIVRNYKAQRFEAYFINLQQNGNLFEFVRQICMSLQYLNLKLDDISDFLTQFGKEEKIRRQFGQEFYIIWIEFFIIKFADIRERLDEKQLSQIPKQKGQLLSFFKKILISYSMTYTYDLQKELLKNITDQTFFKEYLNSKERPGSNMRSRLPANSKSSFKQLPTVQAEDIFRNLLEKIINKIGKFSEETLESRKIQVADMINEILQSSNQIESELLSVNLRSILRNYLGLEVNFNRCKLIKQEIPVIKQGFIAFKDFFMFSDIIIQWIQNKIAIDKLLEELDQKLSQGITNIWYWPIFNERPFITFLINACVEDKQETQQVIQILKKYPPSLRSPIFNSHGRSFLVEILVAIHEGTYRNLYIKCLLWLCKIQLINLKKQQLTGQTLQQMFLAHGMNQSQLLDVTSLIVQDINSFFIYDAKSRQRKEISMSVQHTSELVDKFKNDKFEEKQQLSNIGYSLQYSFTNKYSQGVYKSGRYNKLANYSNDISYEGIVNYGNLSVFGNLIKGFSWRLLQRQSWRVYQLGYSQRQKIVEQILNNNNKVFSLKIPHLEGILQINTEKLTIRTFQSSQNADSIIKEDFGYLIYLPAYKIEKNQQQHIIIEDQIFEFDEEVADPRKALKQQKTQRQNVIIFAQSFEFLGVFSTYLDKQDGYQIDQSQNVLAKDRITIQYFKTWLEINLSQLIQQNLENNNYVNKNKVTNSFKIHQSLYYSIINEFRTIQRSIKKLIIDKWNEKLSQITIENMRQSEESFIFFETLIHYYELRFSKEKQKKAFLIKFDTDQRKYLQQKDDENINIVDMNNKMAQIICTKQQKQKLLAEIQTINQVHQFIYQCPAAFNLMKQHDDDNFLSNLQYKYTKIDEERFQIAMKLRYHPQFKLRLKLFYEMLDAILGQTMQMKIQKEGQYIHLYIRELSTLDVQVSKMGNHILLQFNSRSEKLVKETLKKIQQQKQKWIYEHAKKNSDQYIIKNIIPEVLFQVKQRLQNILKYKAKKGLNPIIQISIIKKNEFSLKVIQIDKQLQNIFDDLVESFIASYEQFLKIKKNIMNVHIYINNCFSRLPKQRMKDYHYRQMYSQFKTLLRKSLLDIINRISQQNYQKLQKKLINFIKNQDLTQRFKTNLYEEQHKNITDQVQKLNIFNIFMMQQVSKSQKKSKVQISTSIATKHFTKQVQELFANYKSSSLNISKMAKFFKSLNIITKLFYGEQLPITKHLPLFQKKLQNNDVILVKVGTGSGKSTVIPPYLVGLGYEKVVVTQPRRLPCREIFKRIKSIFGSGIAGFQIGDESVDKNNSLIYMTDGLLKVKSLFNLKQFDKIDVLVIDEIHERSANIDMLLLLLNQYYRQGNKKLKLILCSATIDKNVSKILQDMNLKIDSFQVETNRFPVSVHKIEEGTILDRILLLCRKLKPDQQLLAFLPGVRQVKIIVQMLITKFNRQAFPLYAKQSVADQNFYLNNGQIFISTSIAETSLTFRKLKYVVDSRISRWVKFNSETELMETEEDFSSNSSIKQRMGRLGRTCPGQYHYFVYHSHDQSNNRQNDRTELQKVDLTNFIFEILLRKNSNFQKATELLARLNQQKLQFLRKVEYSKQILSNMCILTSAGNLIKGVQQLMVFGDLGNPQHNYALNQAKSKNCLINMIYLVSFFMMGMDASTEMLTYLKSQYKGSDLKVVHDFMVEVAAKINLPFIKIQQITQQLKINCPLISNKPWGRILLRVLKKANQLMQSCLNYVPSINWNNIVSILLDSYKNKIFFNQSLFGGNKSQYEKLKKNTKIDYESKVNQKMDEYSKTYQLNYQSLIYSKENLPSIILSMSNNVNPQNECILSICEIIQVSKIEEVIEVNLKGCQCSQIYFKTNDKIKNERQTFRSLQASLKGGINVNNQFPKLQLTGPLNKIADSFKNRIQPQRKNTEIRIDMNKILNDSIDSRSLRLKNDSLLPVIDAQKSKKMFEKLTFKHFKDLFLTTKYDMQKNYGVNIQWEIAAIDRFLVVKNAKNTEVEKILTKLINFFRWFADSQMICTEDFKISPRFIEENPILSKDVRLRIMDRVNQIVDSRIQHYVIKGWVNGRGPFTKYPRTARMIAACWVLSNMFSCVIKGGFVRDWVVNGQEILDTKKDLTKLLQVNKRNKYFEVDDDSVTPSDIDAELSSQVLFDEPRFKKQMAKLGIVVFIEQDGWRKHVLFDYGVPTGGFTADLIQPYTSMCHDSYDFDVNTMYIKKDHLNAIGLKIPLEYVDNYQHKTTKVSLEELISFCKNKQMKKLKDNIPKYRFKKFESRGWKINSQQIFEPICYKSLITQSSPVDISLIGKISSKFEQKMITNGPKVKIVRIESLKNKAWDEVFQSIEHWIICELQAEQKVKNPNGYYNARINSNNALLFHGTSPQGYKNIKQFGFDSRYFGSYGFYGRGAYFADDPMISHGYTKPDAEGNRYMFIVKVALGKQEKLTKQSKQRLGPGKGYHSIFGTEARPHNQYIIERWGQAKPVYLITYRC